MFRATQYLKVFFFSLPSTSKNMLFDSNTLRWRTLDSRCSFCFGGVSANFVKGVFDESRTSGSKTNSSLFDIILSSATSVSALVPISSGWSGSTKLWISGTRDWSVWKLAQGKSYQHRELHHHIVVIKNQLLLRPTGHWMR